MYVNINVQHSRKILQIN